MNIKEKAELAYRKDEAEKLQKRYETFHIRYEYFKNIFGDDIKLVPSYETPTHFEIEGFQFDAWSNGCLADSNRIYKLIPTINQSRLYIRPLYTYEITDLITLGEFFNKIKELDAEILSDSLKPKVKNSILQKILNVGENILDWILLR